jgi:predicted metal-dependent HD superfamily phosphohydrolase
MSIKDIINFNPEILTNAECDIYPKLVDKCLKYIFYNVFEGISSKVSTEYNNGFVADAIGVYWNEWIYTMSLEDRVYHNRYHIFQMINKLYEYVSNETCPNNLELVDKFSFEFFLAIFYHDYVYSFINISDDDFNTLYKKELGIPDQSPHRFYGILTNEALSYYHIENILKNMKIDGTHINYFILQSLFNITEYSLIDLLDEKHHIVKLMRDLDLSILSSDSPRYMTYYSGIYQEYENGIGHAATEMEKYIFNKSRSTFIRCMIDGSVPRIYSTDYFYNKYEEMAKSNLKQELHLIEEKVRPVDEYLSSYQEARNPMVFF